MSASKRRAALEHVEKGTMQQRAGRADLAERHYRCALAEMPRLDDALIALGDLLRRQGRLDEAGAFLQAAQEQAADSAVATGTLALLRIEQARYAEARELAARACALDPRAARWWIAAGIAARRAQDPDAAVPALRRACELAPNNAATWLELAMALERTGDPDSRTAIASARRLAPQSERLRWIELLQLPAITADDGEVRAALAGFDAGLDAVENGLKLDTPQRIAAAFDAALGVVTFQLHYLPGDHTARQRRFGALVERVVAHAAPALVAPVDWRPLAHGGRLRVGFVSAYLYTHSVARYFASWITDLDAERFESFVWHCGDIVDSCSEEIAAASAHFTRSSVALGERIRAAQLDALILLDIGLDPRLQVLAAMRLAPRQYTTFGHPVTSGQTTLDGFLGAELLEGEESQQQYTEKLVRLPGLATRFRRRAEPADGAWLHDVTGGRPALLCLQNLIKLQPSFDAVLARVMQRTNATLVVFEHSAGQSMRFRQRFARALAAVAVDVDTQLRIVRALPYREWLGGVAAATLVLDTPGFSGGVSSLDAISVGTPVIAFAGNSARARQTAAMLEFVGVPELIAKGVDEYVDLAVALFADEKRRAGLRQRLRTNAARLFDNRDAQLHLQEFLLTCVRPAPG